MSLAPQKISEGEPAPARSFGARVRTWFFTGLVIFGPAVSSLLSKLGGSV